MIDEQLEYSISQYVDGTLEDAERTMLEVRLTEDAAARATLDQYRKLGVLLKSDVGLPSIHWGEFARSISSAVDAAQAENAQREAERFRIPRWVRTVAIPMAMAASVLIATGIGIHAIWVGPSRTDIAKTIGVAPPPSFAAVSVFGSQAEPGRETGEVQIAIGPSADAKDDPILVHYSGDAGARSSHVSVASGVMPVHDADSLSFDMQ